jgi:hypothetical protein
LPASSCGKHTRWACTATRTSVTPPFCFSHPLFLFASISLTNLPLVVPHASPFEKQQRRKVWQAVLLQDTFLTVLLSLPPSATHTDVSVDDLVVEDDHSSIGSDDPTDTAYIRGSWTLANLVQETICSPRSLDLPICSTPRHKAKLVADFRAVYRSFPDVFRSWDRESLAAVCAAAASDGRDRVAAVVVPPAGAGAGVGMDLGVGVGVAGEGGKRRVVRQTLWLSSNYFHNLMLVHASETKGVPLNVRGTLEAAHDAIQAFFVLFELFEDEARVWWVFNHRAFLEALCMGNVLREVGMREGPEALERDPLFVRARADIREIPCPFLPFLPQPHPIFSC